MDNLFSNNFEMVCMLATTFVIVLQIFLTQIRPNILSGLIWIQNAWHSDGIYERVYFFFEKVTLKINSLHGGQFFMLADFLSPDGGI